MMSKINTINETNYTFAKQTNFYRGKVRDVYTINNSSLVMIATDRISTFDVILPVTIPFKGQVLNQMAEQALKSTADICPNWLESSPDPNVSIGINCNPYPIEMVIRGYLAGHAWREYRSGQRHICGVPLPEGLKENDKLPNPIITPTIKAKKGSHDEDISKQEIIENGWIDESIYSKLEEYTLALYQRGVELSKKQGLILVDTKYEFGNYKGEIYLIDEIHTPDSSRYYYHDGYQERQDKGEEQKQLSKEFVRQWLIQNDFQGLKGQSIPNIPNKVIEEISNRYIHLYEVITGLAFCKREEQDIVNQMENSVNNFLFNKYK